MTCDQSRWLNSEKKIQTLDYGIRRCIDNQMEPLMSSLPILRRDQSVNIVVVSVDEDQAGNLEVTNCSGQS